MAKKQDKHIRKVCLKCEKEKMAAREFFKSNSSNHKDGRYPICKKCIKENLGIDDNTDYRSQEFLSKFQNVLLEMNKPFLYSLYISSVDESERTGREFLGMYMKNVYLNFNSYNWKDSEFDNEKEEKNEVSTSDSETVEYEFVEKEEYETQDKKDVIRMLGYDPFEFENKIDKKRMYSKLIDFLDESTLEDGLKLQSVIEIVKGFNQIDKINLAITNITNDINNLSNKSGGIKSLIDSKKNILTSVLKLAEDNGISVKHNNQKSKGAGTLSGIIKQLQEKGIKSSEINIYDIDTYEGMKKVADISNRSIMEQLMLNENDYTEMIKDQRDMITKYDEKIIELEEENRLLKLKLKEYEESN